MPLYSFVCLDCKAEVEILCSVSGEMRPSDKCPSCGGRNLKKKPSAANVIFKGEGWTEKGT